MPALTDEFVALNRTFRELEFEPPARDDSELKRLFSRHGALHWADLLSEHRVILLSEAGSGKTAEIRSTAQRLRELGKPAFFLRIEHIQHSMDIAFEEGDYEEFLAWTGSSDEGWLFLDSVDEARLRHVRDFEVAIKILGQRLKAVLQRVHIVITGRTTAWRANTDLLLCQSSFPYQPVVNAPSDQQDPASDHVKSITSDTAKAFAHPFRLFALEDLHGDQVTAFLRARNVQDLKAFQNQVEQKDALHLTTRPQDLSELADYWNVHQCIGSRYELMCSSIDRRLKEHSQDRADVYPIAPDRLRQGARLVAAAATLSQQSAIQTPDGTKNGQGLPLRDVLGGWDDAERQALLERPIFEPGIYGTVRFHHRSVREYLTAEWLNELLKLGSSRQPIENLFFRQQYGIEVVVPTLRPVLSWLAILDPHILTRVSNLAPEVFFEGGDPSRLPLTIRSGILSRACEHLAQPAHGRTLSDFSSVRRFAAPDLADDINTLLARYSEDEDITWFLLLMVWQGQVEGSAAPAKHFALESRSKYTRIAAFRALAAVGSEADRAEVRTAILQESGDLDRSWVAELIPWLLPTIEGVAWLLDALERTAPAKRYQVDSLAPILSRHVCDWPVALLSQLAAGFNALISKPPFSKVFPRNLSQRYRWLGSCAAQVMLVIIRARTINVIHTSALSLLRKIPLIQEAGGLDADDVVKDLRESIAQWAELDRRLFWYDVAQTRKSMASKSVPQKLSHFSQAGSYGRLWSMSADSFDATCADIANRELLDDKLVALTLADWLYRTNEHPPAWLEQIKTASQNDEAVEAMLGNMLNPPVREPEEWEREHARWMEKSKHEMAALEKNKLQWKEHLNANVELLRSSPQSGEMTGDQVYLLNWLRENSNHSSLWNEEAWQNLIPEFGELIASSFRDGAVGFWRGYTPQLRSEGAPANSTPYKAILGLMGLAIEAKEHPAELKQFSEVEARQATRYALHELNGFPTWLPTLYGVQPQAVFATMMTEIDFELASRESAGLDHYMLYDISWSGDWMWDQLAPHLAGKLKRPPKNMGRLRNMLNIIQGSSLDSSILVSLAAQKAKSIKNNSVAPLWFAIWAGLDPSNAIANLAARLIEIQSEEDQTRFAMHFITALVGSRRERRSVREAYRTIGHMKALYLLMNRYIHEEDDIQRANLGAYSPELRDDAQDARNALLSFIRDTPGKEAYFALMEISLAHPAASSRPWMALQAKEKAALDADMSPWSPQQVRDFHERQERTPTNPRDLCDLAVERLLDLKHDLEDGDSSEASLLQPRNQETEIRKFIGNWCRKHSSDRYTISQEEEFADAKRADLRFHGSGFDAQVPVELKLADKWTGPRLLERFENQLCGDYMRDGRSSYGIFLLVYHGTEHVMSWTLNNGQVAANLEDLVDGLQQHWTRLAPQFPGIEDIKVIGIDLTKRGKDASTPLRKKTSKPKTAAGKK